MSSAFSKNAGIQIVLSIPLVFLGVVVAYLIHRGYYEQVQIAPYNLIDGSEVMESPSNKQDDPQIKKEPSTVLKSKPANPQNRDLSKHSTDLAKQLEKFKYEGYLRIGNMKIAWLFDGNNRIPVTEGSVLDNTIEIDEIHENFLSASTANGQIIQKIYFTPNPDEQDSKLPSSAAVTAKNTNSKSRITYQRFIPKTADKTSPPSSRYEQFSTPEQMSPAVVAKDENKDKQAVNNIGAVVSIDPALKIVKSLNETFILQVKIDNGLNIFAVPFDINYDPNILEVIGLHESSYLKKDGGQTTFLTSIGKGKITIGLTRLGRIGGVSGSGTLMSITFRALKHGTTFLSVANGRLMDSRLNALPVRFVSGKVRVE